MTSSLESAISLLNKWKADELLVNVGFFDGPLQSPRSFAFSITGVLTRVSENWVEILSGADSLRLRLDLPGVRFEYVEPRDRSLREVGFCEETAELAGRLVEGNLSVTWEDGNFCVFSALREGTAFFRK